MSTVNLLIFAMRFPPEEVGTALYAANLADGLQRRGVNVTVLAPDYGRSPELDDGLAYPVRRIHGRYHRFAPWRYPRARAALARTVRELHPDVLWATNGMATRVAGTMLGRLTMPLIGSLHGTDITTRLPGRSPRTWVESIPQRAFYRSASSLVTNSRFTLDMAVRKGIDRNRLRLAYLGIDMPDDWDSVARGAASLLPDLADRRIVLTVGSDCCFEFRMTRVGEFVMIFLKCAYVASLGDYDGPPSQPLRMSYICSASKPRARAR